MKVTIWQGCRVVAELDLPDGEQDAPEHSVSIDPWAKLAGIEIGSLADGGHVLSKTTKIEDPGPVA